MSRQTVEARLTLRGAEEQTSLRALSQKISAEMFLTMEQAADRVAELKLVTRCDYRIVERDGRYAVEALPLRVKLDPKPREPEAKDGPETSDRSWLEKWK